MQIRINFIQYFYWILSPSFFKNIILSLFSYLDYSTANFYLPPGDGDEFKERTKTTKSIFRSSSFNKLKNKKRSSSSSSFREQPSSPLYRAKFRAQTLSLESTDSETFEPTTPAPPSGGLSKRSSFTDNVFTKIARQYSFTRSNRRQQSKMTDRNSTKVDDIPISQKDDSNVVFNKRERRRKIGIVQNTVHTKVNDKNILQTSSTIFTNGNVVPVLETSFTSTMTTMSSDSSCPNSPTYNSPPISPGRIQLTPSPNAQRSSFHSPVTINDEFKVPGTDQSMSMDSIRNFTGWRPISLSSVTSSISSRTSRGSDYFSSASSGNDQHQVYD